MDYQNIYRACVRIVFLFAFIAFLSASISHVATFFHNFEEDKENWLSPYMLAVSIDLTALVLTIGVMFFSKTMTWFGKTITWMFIIFLTAFSWFVNWEYARTYQAHELKAGSLLVLLNPILASSFAFLNLAYSFVSEQFNAKTKTQEELQTELDDLEMTLAMKRKRDELKAQYGSTSVTSLIKRSISTAKDVIDHAESTFKGTPTMTNQSEEIVTPIEEIYDGNLDIIPVQSDDNVVMSTSSTSGFTPIRNVSLESACEQIGCDMRTLRQLISKGKIKTRANSDKLVTKSSLDAYLANRRPKKQKQAAHELPVPLLPTDNDTPIECQYAAYTNGHSMQDTEALSIPLLSIRQDNDR